jgi:serine/threonine protein kinase
MRTVGPYELIRHLGTGGMGEVWMGRRTTLGGGAKSVALKLLSGNRVDGENARKMFLEEARLSMLLTNANIVQVFDVGEDRETCYMAMEWVDGLDLSAFAARLRSRGERLPIQLIAYIVGEILKALAYAHDLKHEGTRLTIIHRDISPHNVMISFSGEVKLMDFGIARMASEQTSGVHVKGKLRYMPPEQLRGSTREPTIDLFAVGAILHELLDGRPFRGDVVDEPRLYGMILDGEVAPLSCVEVPREIDELRQGLLAPNVTDRIPSARAAFRKLSEWPGYRDGKFELEDLINSVLLTGNATTVLPAPTDVLPEDERETTNLDRVVEGSNDGPTTVTRPRQKASEKSRNAASRRRVAVLSGGLGLMGLAFGVATFGVVIGWWGNDTNESATVVESTLVEPRLADPVPVEPTPTDAVVVEPPVEPTPTEPTTVASLPVEPPPVVQEQVVEPGVETPTIATPPAIKVGVTIKADPKLNGFWIEIKLAGKPHEIKKPATGSAFTRLKPGNYTVQYRTEVDGAWTNAGSVMLPADDKDATVLVQANGRAVVR